MREGMYVSVMCSWTCVLVCLLVFSFTLSPSLRLVIVFHLAWLRRLCWFQCTNNAQTFIASTLSQDIGIVAEGEGKRSKEWGKTEREWGWVGGWLSFFRLQGRCFSKSAWGYTPAPRLPEAFRLPPNSQPPSVSHGQMMGHFPLLCPALFFLFPFFFQSAHPHRLEWQSCQGTVRSH